MPRGFVGGARGCDQEVKEGTVRLLGAVRGRAHVSLQGKAIVAGSCTGTGARNIPLATLSDTRNVSIDPVRHEGCAMPPQ